MFFLAMIIAFSSDKWLLGIFLVGSTLMALYDER